jgi:hypothetical protein|tara:strand:+ start:2535 stop:3371 length:837 start_codon:yes stop_codon:yes gene_type:complete
MVSSLDRFFHYINERHRIYLKRQEGEPFPWTEDKILQTYSFCNVFRELDKVTIWVRKNWREPYADHPNLPFAMSMARQINWPDTLEEIGFPEEWNPERTKEIMQARMDRGEKVYTGAYMLTGTLGGTKVQQTVDKILTPVYHNPPEIIPHSLKETWKNYLPYAGFSGFMSYEVVTDLRHTRHLENAEDVMTWANAGPGAKRGLNRIHGRSLKQAIKEDQLTQEMKSLLTNFNQNILFLLDKELEMREIEHCLCEFDKYERVRLGEGRPRSKYKYTGEK